MLKSLKCYICVCPLQGQAYVNGFNLGRYWPVVGPQITLYVPANVLNAGNKLVLFEVDNAPCQSPDHCYVEFLDKPTIDGPVSPMNGGKKTKGEIESFDDWTAKYRDFMPGGVKTKQETLDPLDA